MASADIFEPAMFSLAENLFLLQHLGESPEIAADEDAELPKGVNREAVMPFLDRIYRLQQLQIAKRKEWAGVMAIKESIAAFLDWMEKARLVKARGGPAVPSMYVFPESGAPKRAASGTDNEIVQSAIVGPNNQRRYFRVDLRRPPHAKDNKALFPWMEGGEAVGKTSTGIADEITDTVNGRIGKLTCSICGKGYEYQVGSSQLKNLATAHIRRHLLHVTTDIDRHRILHARYGQ